MMVESVLPFLAVLIPLLAVLVVPRLSDAQGNRFTALATVLSLLVILMMFPQIHAGNTLVMELNPGSMVSISFMADGLSFLVGLISIILWIMASIYGIEYMHKEHAQARYNIFSLLSLAGMLGVVFTKNLFSLYIFFELLSMASYVMVIHQETPEAKSAGLTYIVMGIGGGLILLFSIIGTYAIAGTGDLTHLSKISEGLAGHPATPFIFLGYLIGFGVKAGVFPAHIWLPTAHPVAPAPASALLSGVMIKAGAYGILRTVFTITGSGMAQSLPLGKTLLVLAVITMFVGSFMAIVQTDIKRLLAYSSIAQMGYIVLGAALLSPKGLIGAVIHIFHHGFMKGTLFLAAGAFIHQTGLRKIDDLRGIGKRMPLTLACFTMAALSMIGLPPFVGFISKWYLALGAMQSEAQGVLGSGGGFLIVGFLLLSSLLNAVYYGPIIVRGWFNVSDGDNNPGPTNSDDCPSNPGKKNDDPGGMMLVPLFILALGTVVFGIFPQLSVGLAEIVVKFYF